MPNNSKNKTTIADLSPHLFWDVDKNGIDWEKNKKFIIQRVMTYGLINDWQIIYTYYGMVDIAKTAMTIRDLDQKSLSFIALLSKVPKEKFLCYTTMGETLRYPDKPYYQSEEHFLSRQARTSCQNKLRSCAGKQASKPGWTRRKQDSST
jgi:hypothetical protein